LLNLDIELDGGKAGPSKGRSIVKYKYWANDEVHEGTHVNILDYVRPFVPSYDSRLHKQLSNTLADDKQIDVWVDPKNANCAVLSNKQYLGRLVLIFLLVIALFVAAYHFYTKL
jgi:hypothetical protein